MKIVLLTKLLRKLELFDRIENQFLCEIHVFMLETRFDNILVKKRIVYRSGQVHNFGVYKSQ